MRRQRWVISKVAHNAQTAESMLAVVPLQAPWGHMKRTDAHTSCVSCLTLIIFDVLLHRIPHMIDVNGGRPNLNCLETIRHISEN